MKSDDVPVSGPTTCFRAVDKSEGAILEDIVAQVCASLSEGAFAPGDALPGEREMAAQFGVSRNTLREALTTLSLMGVLEIRQGLRTRIAADGSTALNRAFEFLILLDRPDYVAIHLARQSLEVQLAGEAAIRATKADMEAIGAALDECLRIGAESIVDSHKVSAGNYVFHVAIARAAHNPLLERVLVRLHAARRAQFRTLIPQGTGRPETNEIHERVYYAIRDHDADAARRAMAMDMGIALRVLHKIHGRKNGNRAGAEYKYRERRIESEVTAR